MTVYQTDADKAELDLLVHALVTEAWPHRGKAGFPEALAEALEAIQNWRRRRELASIAAYLRAREDLREPGAAA